MNRLAPLIALLALAAPLAANEWHLGLLGALNSESHEYRAAKTAVEEHDVRSLRQGHTLKLVFAPHANNVGSALEAAKKLVADPLVLGVVVHGEEGADAQVLQVFADAKMPVVQASSWASPRPMTPTALWLSPSGQQLAQIAAQYAAKAAKKRQVAVVDNGAATAVAMAKAFAQRFRELGGKIEYEGEWQGSEWGLTRTVKDLKLYWPQGVFFAGEAVEAGQLAKEFKKEKETKDAVLLGLPTLFEAAFFDTGRLDTKRSIGVFPCPDYRSSVIFSRLTGLAINRKSAQYKGYVHWAVKKPGKWNPMVFDAAQILVDTYARLSQPTSLSPTALAPSGETLAAQPSREEMLEALMALEGYKGIRGMVKFTATREPMDPKAMIFSAIQKVNSKMMQWRDFQYGPPFRN